MQRRTTLTAEWADKPTVSMHDAVLPTRRRLRGISFSWVVEWLCAVILTSAVMLYTIAYSSLSIAAYRSGRTLFDLAAFEQSFWSATRGRLFVNSLEVTRPDLVMQMSHFGRHLSPIFLLLLPIYALHQFPSTLLVLQSLALGGAAIPLYLFARRRLGSPSIAVLFAGLYLANPAVHDVNTVNEFHEISFVIPIMFVAFYAIESERWPLYFVAVFAMLAVKEDVALEVIALGLYVCFIARRRRIGIVTIVVGVVWFLAAMLLIIPAFRGPNGPIPLLGYGYLGTGVFGIARGILTRPGPLWHVVTAAAKLRYLFWLLAPVAFTALLAPEVLLVAAPPMLIILASTFPDTYAIFAQYVAPIVPIVFIAAIVGVERARGAGRRLGFNRMALGMTTGLLLLTICGGTLFAQLQLHRFPTHLVSPDNPSPQAADAIALVGSIPRQASLVIEDHRWLAHAANRQFLYVLSSDSPEADYVLSDGSALQPITNFPKPDRVAAMQRLTASQNYLTFQCTGGFVLDVRKTAFARDHPQLPCSLAPD